MNRTLDMLIMFSVGLLLGAIVFTMTGGSIAAFVLLIFFVLYLM